MELLFATGVSGLGLLAATKEDLRIFKVLIFSRATVAFIRLIGDETGLFTPVREGEPNKKNRIFTVEFFLTWFSMVLMLYFYVMETNSMPQNMLNLIHRLGGLDKDEKQLFDSIRAIQELKRMGN